MIARLVFASSCMAYAVGLGVAAVVLPSRVPLHFGASGEVDRWGSRSEAVLLFTVLGVAMAVLLGWLASRTPTLPESRLNVPHKRWWTALPAREERMRAMLATDLYVVGAATVLLLLGLLIATVSAARADDPRLGAPFVVLAVAYVVALAGWLGYLFLRRYRPRSE